MLNRDKARTWYTLVSFAQKFAAASSIALSACLKGDVTSANKIAPLLGSTLGAVQGSLWITLPAATISAALLGWLKNRVGAPWYWETVHAFLDCARDQFFADRLDDPEPDHRVTLFRRKRFCFTREGWWWKGWIWAVERSGNTKRSSSVVFRATDDFNKNNGVAGVVWGTKRPLPVSDLPDLEVDETPETIAEYAKKTWVSPEWIAREKPRSRSLLGIPVEVRNEPWGVLVLDSRAPDGVSRVTPEMYRPYAKALGKLLERS
jgi:GAF domain-containing protein